LKQRGEHDCDLVLRTVPRRLCTLSTKSRKSPSRFCSWLLEASVRAILTDSFKIQRIEIESYLYRPYFEDNLVRTFV